MSNNINKKLSSTIFKSTLMLMAIFSGAVVHANCALDPDCPLVWSDEFDGNSLDTGKWEYMIGSGTNYGLPSGWGNNERQWYTSFNDTVANGVLTITAKDDGFAGYDYTSTRIRTKDQGDWTYGRFEMRARLPVGQGMWPAFWMLPTDSSIYGTWAAGGEIDIMEIIGSIPDRILGTIHYGGSYPDNVFSGSEYFLPQGSAHNEFHTYAVEWQEGEIRWYVDDAIYAIKNDWYSTNGQFPAPFDEDFHLLLNLAVGGNLPGNPDGSTVFPMDYVIDYVRVYELPPEVPTSPELVFDDMEHGDPFGNGWFAFNGDNGAGGSIMADSSTQAPTDGGLFSLAANYGSNNTTGFAGGFGRTFPLDLTNLPNFNFWINPAAGQQYTLQVNFQEDDNGDNAIAFPPDGADDEFQFDCVVGPAGPCAIAGGGWQKITISLDDLYDDNGFHFGGNGVFDPYVASNGQLITIVMAIIATSGSDMNLKTDFWSFSSAADTDNDGVLDSVDNCSAVDNPDQTDADNDGFGNICDPDLTNDGVVNFFDISQFINLFLTTDPVADFNSDGSVNFFDYIIIQNMFLQPPGPGAVSN